MSFQGPNDNKRYELITDTIGHCHRLWDSWRRSVRCIKTRQGLLQYMCVCRRQDGDSQVVRAWNRIIGMPAQIKRRAGGNDDQRLQDQLAYLLKYRKAERGASEPGRATLVKERYDHHPDHVRPLIHCIRCSSSIAKPRQCELEDGALLLLFQPPCSKLRRDAVSRTPHRFTCSSSCVFDASFRRIYHLLAMVPC